MVFSMALNSCQLYIPARRPVLKRGGIRCSSASVSAASTNFDLKTYWATLIKEINQKLDEAIPVQYPNQIYEAMRYSVLAKGAKRAPPIMCVSACELFGGNRLAAFPTACALEMVCFLLSNLFLLLIMQILCINRFNSLEILFSFELITTPYMNT